MELSKLFIQRRFMKKYSQLFLLSSALLSVFSAQLTVQASEANNASKSSNPTTLASDVTVNVSGNSVSINYIRSQVQNPYTISHAVWSDENGQDDLKWYSAPQTSTTVDLSQHSGYGTFHVHTYININGKMIGLNGTTFTLNRPTSQTKITTAGQIGQIHFTRNKDQKNSKIVHAIWSEENGSDDLNWYDAEQEITKFDFSKHKGYGRYFVDTYENKNGKMIYQSGTTFNLEKPNPTIQTSFPEPGIMDIRIKNVPETIYKLTVPTWSDKNGQDDLQWYAATKNPDGSYNVRVELKKHNYDTGTYHIHLYGESYVKPEFTGLAGITAQVDADKLPSEEEQKPFFSVENINQEQGTYTVKIKETSKSKSIQSVRIPIWSTTNQSNIKWYTATDNGDGTFSTTFNIRNHQALSGTYINHIYVKYKDGSEHSYATDSVSMSAEQIKTKVAVTKRSIYNYEVTVTDAYGDGNIILPTWSEVNGQDDIQWYTATKTENGIYKFTIDTQKHTGSGLFHTHVYRNLNGKMIGLTGTSYQVEKPAISFQPNYAAATTYPKGQCTWGAKALAPWAGNYWGNGGDWAASARRAGFKTGTTPQVGAIICWTDGGYGHVGVVTHVASNTRIQIQEANYAGKQNIGNFRGWFNPHAAGQGAVSYIYPK